MNYYELTTEHLDDMARLYVDAFNAPPWNDEWTVETARKRLHQMIHCEGSFGLVAYQNGKLSGLILGGKEQFYDGVMFTIKEFCVDQALHHTGIGTSLLNACEKRLNEKGIKTIILVTSRNDGTEGFYRRRGFHSIDGMVMMGKELCD
ncbi:GNAT family N-acetyltransferase [Sporolactobacillus nakayamae]|uniref:Ribosomal protein S18 acetylase RimI n=1 Tax=Sporolactobacillus nakayamae TaxID=269670 RepID=A0A1I2PKZ3_9BACL|nr:GNAT family N-acetyltransferase [Sporolactobacillus nakayamae]SFG16842.1 Ribosomal protein S18 acetylase RimI [Sporolactobacillus nakayamae]